LIIVVHVQSGFWLGETLTATVSGQTDAAFFLRKPNAQRFQSASAAGSIVRVWVSVFQRSTKSTDQ
jgi:hypothetical protein